jgi:hypothetical protein
MKFNQGACFGFMVGWFILAEMLRALLTGSIPLIFNIAVDGIIGIGLSIAFGYFFGRFKK